MSQKTLDGKKVEKKKRNWKTKRFLEYSEFDAETGKPTKEGWDFVHGEKTCSCGASFLIADDYESTNLYWLNRKEMESAKNSG